MPENTKINNENSKTEMNSFVIEFNEDGSPIDCHQFIRFSGSNDGIRIKFHLSEAFVPENSKICIELQRDGDLYKTLNFENVDIEGTLTTNLIESGTFRFYLRSGNKCYTSGFIQISPNFLDQDNIKLITLVSKWMGPLAKWEKYFEIIKHLGYNMIHFTPLQQRGQSNSPYSIKDQLKLSDDVFKSDQELDDILKIMNNKYDIYGMIDIVWNHTACDSSWLIEYPEAGYNLENSPHLKVAFDLDESILDFSSKLNIYQLSGHLNDENDLLEMMKVFKDKHLPKSRLWEFFVINVSSSERLLEEAISQNSSSSMEYKLIKRLEKAVENDGKCDRFSNKMNLSSVLSYYSKQIEEIRSSEERQRSQLVSNLLADYRQQLDQLNLDKYQKYDEIINVACRNIFNRALYERISGNGPKIGQVCESLPLVPTYFTRVNKDDKIHALANNGWIWNADPFKNFAESSSEAYLRREVIVWGDCVKLRYGEDRNDNPWLWDHMAEYSKRMAKYFHAFRIDNCHSTPIHVASYLLKEARKVRSDLYVCAELFTGSEEKDMKFVTSLGINSLIREAMFAWDFNEITRLSLNYGGSPIGSLQTLPEHIKYSHENISHVKSRPHNIFFDCTHDNEPPAQKRTPQDTLSNSAIVSFTRCATGSTFGYDQLVPHHINVVEESRNYDLNVFACPFSKVKKYLNEFHSNLVQEGCTEIFAKSYKNGIVLISVDNPETHCGYTLITKTGYESNCEDSYEVIDFPGCDLSAIYCAQMTEIEKFEKSSEIINGLNVIIEIIEGEEPCTWFTSTQNHLGSTIELKSIPQGAFMIVRRSLLEVSKLDHLPFLQGDMKINILRELTDKLNLIDLNYVLYRCDEEEKDEFNGKGGVYDIPGYGQMVYCGTEGARILMEMIKRHNNLDHPLCNNLREGTWLLDYTADRFKRKENESINNLGKWIEEVFDHLKGIPGYLRPKYCIKVFEEMSRVFIDRALDLMNPRLRKCGEFAKRLALGSVQMVGVVPSTGLSPFGNDTATLCAGLPHFSTHHMRCWGRDIFVSFRGLLLIPGRFDIARSHLLTFAGCVLHGLIPNLLDSARRPRFNARDATWWFMQALQDYCKYSTEGYDILNTEIPLRFPDDEYINFDDERIFKKTKTMKEIVQLIMQKHAEGIHFREWNAGPALDSLMRSEGFQIDIEVDWKTGFIHGGNAWNCGTWMDKMGESEMAGNRGIPTTPRDGSAIEITALLYSTLEWLTSLSNSYRFKGVKCCSQSKDNTPKFVQYSEWSELIQESFELEYYLSSKGYYKDTVGGSNPRSCLQMRPNYLMAMAISPGLFNVRNARIALTSAEKHLTGPLGMKTLSSHDPDYRPDYNNSWDCTDSSIARGANYHQGPEWLWCMGFYLRAWLTFNLSTADTPSITRNLVLTRLQPHFHYLRNNPFASLPELTNGSGRECRDSCLVHGLFTRSNFTNKRLKEKVLNLFKKLFRFKKWKYLILKLKFESISDKIPQNSCNLI